MKNEDRLKRDLENRAANSEDRNNDTYTAAKREYELKAKKIIVACFFYLLIFLAVMYCGGVVLKHAEETRTMLLGLAALLIGYESTVLIKLAYTNVGSLLRTLQAVKEVQLELAEHKNSNSSLEM